MDMKRWLIVFLAGVVLFLGGCSLLNDAKDTLTYINEATDYLTAATDFANEAPALAQQAVSDLQAAEDLEGLLQEMQTKLEGFNDLQAPEVVADLHQQIVEKNNIIADGIEIYLNDIKDGLLDAKVLENTELFQSIQDITSIVDQIKQFGE
jgi:hypothetical protein